QARLVYAVSLATQPSHAYCFGRQGPASCEKVNQRRVILAAKRGARVGLVFLSQSCIGLACQRVSLAYALERMHLCDSPHTLCRRVLGPNNFARQYPPACSGHSLGIQPCFTAMRHGGKKSQQTCGGTRARDENIRQVYKRNTCTLWCRTDGSSSR